MDEVSQRSLMEADSQQTLQESQMSMDQDYQGSEEEDQISSWPDILNYDDQFQCGKCKKIFSQLRSCRRHIQVTHGPAVFARCRHCNFKSKWRGNFLRHYRLKHTEHMNDVDLLYIGGMNQLRQTTVGGHHEIRRRPLCSAETSEGSDVYAWCRQCVFRSRKRSEVLRHYRIEHGEHVDDMEDVIAMPKTSTRPKPVAVRTAEYMASAAAALVTADLPCDGISSVKSASMSLPSSSRQHFPLQAPNPCTTEQSPLRHRYLASDKSSDGTVPMPTPVALQCVGNASPWPTQAPACTMAGVGKASPSTTQRPASTTSTECVWNGPSSATHRPTEYVENASSWQTQSPALWGIDKTLIKQENPGSSDSSDVEEIDLFSEGADPEEEDAVTCLSNGSVEQVNLPVKEEHAENRDAQSPDSSVSAESESSTLTPEPAHPSVTYHVQESNRSLMPDIDLEGVLRGTVTKVTETLLVTKYVAGVKAEKLHRTRVYDVKFNAAFKNE